MQEAPGEGVLEVGGGVGVGDDLGVVFGGEVAGEAGVVVGDAIGPVFSNRDAGDGVA